MSTEKGQKMTPKMSTRRNKIPLYFILRVILAGENVTHVVTVAKS